MNKFRSISIGDKFKDEEGNTFIVSIRDNLYYLVNIDTGEMPLAGIHGDHFLGTLAYGFNVKLSRVKKSAKKSNTVKEDLLKQGDKVIYSDISITHMKDWLKEVEGKVFTVMRDVMQDEDVALIHNDSVFSGNNLLEDIKYLKKEE